MDGLPALALAAPFTKRRRKRSQIWRAISARPMCHAGDVKALRAMKAIRVQVALQLAELDNRPLTSSELAPDHVFQRARPPIMLTRHVLTNQPRWVLVAGCFASAMWRLACICPRNGR